MRWILAELHEFFAPLVPGLSSPEGFARLLSDLGFDAAAADLNDLLASLSALNQAVTELHELGERSQRSGSELTAEDFTRIAELGHTVFQGLRDLPLRASALRLPTNFFQQAFDHLLAEYLYYRTPVLFRLLTLLGVLDFTHLVPGRDADARQVPFDRAAFVWDRLTRGMADPAALAKDVYGWGTPQFEAGALLYNVVLLSQSLGIVGRAEDLPQSLRTRFLPPNLPVGEAFGVRFPFYEGPPDTLRAEFGVLALPVKGTGIADTGIGLMPYLEGAAAGSYLLTDDGTLTLTVGADAQIAGGVVFSVRPSGLAYDSGVIDQTAGDASFLVDIRKTPAAGSSSILLFGESNTTRLECTSVRGAVGGKRGDLYVSGTLEGLRLVIDTSDGGFLALLASDQLAIDAGNLVASWRFGRGIYFEHGDGLAVRIPLGLQVGPILVRHVGVDLLFAPDLSLTVSVQGTATVGPVSVAVDHLGLRIAIVSNDEGQFGRFDIAAGIQFPTGLGVLIDAGVVTGGGFLSFDQPNGRYIGVLQLQMTETVSVTAFALLTTRLSNERAGFSLVVLITAQGFNPVPLGFGFTLTGVGGLVGINRTTNVDLLRAGLRSRTLDSLLFPVDPIRNAPQIVSNLNAVFPPGEGRYVFGPVAKIAWGTPTLLTINLALVLELPAPVRLLVLAQLKALLPANSDDQTALVRVNMDALGVIDFDRGEISLDATLYDSKIAQFTISGEMALRARWSGEPMFILAIGGFNPRFPVPTGFPRLSRVTVTLASTDTVRLRLEAYLALTSNTVQFGARIDFYAKVSDFTLQGLLGFDTFLQFNPFGFIADMAADLALKRGTATLLIVNVAMTLSGPSPWHAHGRARFEVLFIKFTVTFDVTIGERRLPPPPEPPVNVRARLVEALQDPRSWSVGLPDGATPLVTFRKTSASAGVLVHPLGNLAVHQRIVPLGVEIARYGTAAVEGERRFQISEIRLNGTPLTATARTTVMDSFAPAEFFDLRDDEKLSRPAFESFPAGFRFSAGSLTFCTLRLEPSQQQIALRAYQRYRERSRPREVQDWLAAEYEFTHPPHAQIQLRAYYKYVARGRAPGRALDDWLVAEAELSRPTAQQIAQRAYFRHMSGGPVPMQALDDWVQAHSQLPAPHCIFSRAATFDARVIDDDAAAAGTFVEMQQPAAAAPTDFAAADLLGAAPPPTTASERYGAPPRTQLTIQALTFAVASTQDLSVTRVAATYTEAFEELGKMVRNNPAARRALHIVGRHERESV